MWGLTDKFWDWIETVSEIDGTIAMIRWGARQFKKFRKQRTEHEHIQALIAKIWNDAFIYRLFLELAYGREGRLPSISVKWRITPSKELLYLGDLSKQNEDEKKEGKALQWLMIRDITKPTTFGIYDTQDHYTYSITAFGNKIKLEFESVHPPDTRLLSN